jgi:hypothetical protein
MQTKFTCLLVLLFLISVVSTGFLVGLSEGFQPEQNQWRKCVHKCELEYGACLSDHCAITDDDCWAWCLSRFIMCLSLCDLPGLDSAGCSSH